jgi:hypothetical protein
MTELERRLRAVQLEWPPQPDLTLAVRGRIAAEQRAPLLRRRPLVLALAALAVALAAALAVPQARSSILRWLGLRHVRVVHVGELPPTRPLSGAVLGTRSTEVAATRSAGFELAVPREHPDSVYIAQTSSGTRVTLVWGKVTKPRLMLSEFRGYGTTKYVEKLVGGGTHVERVQVDGSPGLWLSGAPHAVYFAKPGEPDNVYLDEPFLAGDTLVWERREGLTFRLEGRFSKDEALRLAKSLR